MVELDHSPWAARPALVPAAHGAARGRGRPRVRRGVRERVLPRRADRGRATGRSTGACASAPSAWTRPRTSSRTSSRRSPSQGLTVELSHPELGWGQQELSTRHAPALRAADNQVTYRQTVRGVAARRGLIASLAPKPFADQAGSGAHLHWSIWDTAHTMNRLADASDPDGLSPLARHAIAGVLAHLPGPARPDDAERQLVPPPAAALLELGVHRLGHREPRGRGPRPDPLLGRRGGLDEPRAQGQRRERQPVHLARRRDGGGPRRHRARARPGRARSTSDPGNLTDDERARRGIRRFPETASEALDELEKDEVLIGRPGRAARRPSTSRSGAPRPPRTPSRTTRTSSSTTSSSTDRAGRRCPSTSPRSRSSTTTATRCCASSRPTTTRSGST